MPASDHGAVLRDALRAAIGCDLDAAYDLFTEDVLGWSPNLVVTSRAELLMAMLAHEDALTELEVTIEPVDVIGDKAIAEWVATATFSGPFLVDDDLLVEPNGRRLVMAGVTIAEFRGAKIHAFRSYFDDAAFLEQMLTDA